MRILIFLAILLSYGCTAQIKCITQTGRYTPQISSQTDHYYYFGGYYIDRNKEGIINLISLEKGINSIIKDSKYSGYIILNIENKVYQELKEEPITHKNYKKNIKSFVDMVELVKELRPNAKVAIYNIPFMFHYEVQRKRSDYDKLYPILNVVDFFAPSLYIHYSDEQRKDSFFENYINSNLELNFEYAEKLNKKVYPFVWYRIHPSNKKYGSEIANSSQYTKYLQLIKNYRYKNYRVEKIIYWEPSKETININQKLIETINILKKT